jgi:hypothetical protein
MSKRAEFVLDTQVTPLISTGNVAPVTKYDPNLPAGAPRQQDTDETGSLLWVADFLIDDGDSGPDARANVAGVRIAARQRPVFQKYALVEFAELRCSVYVNKQGQLGLSYTGRLRPASAESRGASAKAA